MSLKDIQDALIDLYLGLKVRKLVDLNNMSDNSIEEEKNHLYKIPILDIINYITNSFEILSEIKAQEKYEEKLCEDEKKEDYYNFENEEDANGLKLYEGMLIKAESDIRNHIRVRNMNIFIFKLQIEQELRLEIEDLESDLENVINKYNILINLYNNLKNEKKIENTKINDYYTLVNNEKSLSKTTSSSINITKLKNNNKKIFNNNINNKINNIYVTENNKNLNCFDNDYINNLKKENERLKKLVVKYGNNQKSINFNQNKRKINSIKERKNIFNYRFNKKNVYKKRSTSNNNSKDHSYIANYYKNKFKNIQNNINNKSDVMLLMNKTNYSIIQKKRFKDLLINEETSKNNKSNSKKNNIENKFFNTISSINNNEYFKDNNVIKKHHTCISSSKRSIIKNDMTNQRLINKLKVKCKNTNNETINDSNKAGETLENGRKRKKIIISKYTPKRINENNKTFFSHSNNNNHYKIKNKLKHINVLDLENNSSNIDLEGKNTTVDCFFKNNNNKNINISRDKNSTLIKNKIKRINTEEIGNNKSRLIIHRNTENKKNNKFRLIKEFKIKIKMIHLI